MNAQTTSSIAARMLALLLLSTSPLLLAETFEVEVYDFYFEPEVVVINVGDTVRFTNQEGIHNAVARDGSFDSGPPASGNWQYSVTFDAPTPEILYDSTNYPGMTGGIVVNGNGAFVIDQSITGSWFEPTTAGQGFSLEVLDTVDPAVLTVFWFTFDPDTGQALWLTGAGPIEGDQAQVELFSASGGNFAQPPATDASARASATFTFTSCGEGNVSFAFNDGPSGQIELSRVTPQCAQ